MGLKLAEPRVKNAIKKGLDKIGKMIERDVRIFAPRKTGLLKSSINSTQRGFKVVIGSPLNYAEYMEWPGNVIREGRRPYFEPAFDKNMPLIAMIIVNEIKMVMK